MIAKYGTFEFALAERYRFEEELGRGSMGIVYRAQDLRLGRPVAIKMLHPVLTSELGESRFQSEIRIAPGCITATSSVYTNRERPTGASSTSWTTSVAKRFARDFGGRSSCR